MFAHSGARVVQGKSKPRLVRSEIASADSLLNGELEVMSNHGEVSVHSRNRKDRSRLNPSRRLVPSMQVKLRPERKTEYEGALISIGSGSVKSELSEPDGGKRKK